MCDVGRISSFGMMSASFTRILDCIYKVRMMSTILLSLPLILPNRNITSIIFPRSQQLVIPFTARSMVLNTLTVLYKTKTTIKIPKDGRPKIPERMSFWDMRSIQTRILSHSMLFNFSRLKVTILVSSIWSIRLTERTSFEWRLPSK